MTAIYFGFIVGMMFFSFLLEFFSEWLNLKAFSPTPPTKLQDLYSPEAYAKARTYSQDGTQFHLIQLSVSFLAQLIFFEFGGFGWVDRLSRSFTQNEYVVGLLFVVLLTSLSSILALPFSLFHTFILEEKYGFNKTTLKTFISDRIKGMLVGTALGTPLLLALFYFFDRFEASGWWIAWLLLTGFQLLLTFLAPAVILPLFNKFTPLEDGSLKEKIHALAKEQNYSLTGIFLMDGSKRSSKANAFLTGFGKFKKLVFFDTLLQKLSTDEILAVLAHELGHFKLNHIKKSIVLSFLTTGLSFYLVGVFFKNEALFAAFGVKTLSVHGSLVFAAFLYAPISLVLGILSSALSRKFEFEADAFAAKAWKNPKDLATALKKLATDHLSHPTPHRLKVVLEYSHPPILERLNRLDA